MGKYKNIIRKIQAFMDSARGKTVLNYLYSWGAAIVILGTLFKLTHIAGANIMLFVGMGTEVLVFFFSAFERPYDVAIDELKEEASEEAASNGSAVKIEGAPMGGGTIIINGNMGSGSVPVDNAFATTGNANIPATTNNPDLYPQMDKVTEEYIEKVTALNEAIRKIAEQANTLGMNMAEMETLSRNLTGINALYEVQLRSAGNQVGAIDQVNEQTMKMAKQIEELNAMYARMIQAMTMNINKPQI